MTSSRRSARTSMMPANIEAGGRIDAARLSKRISINAKLIIPALKELCRHRFWRDHSHQAGLHDLNIKYVQLKQQMPDPSAVEAQWAINMAKDATSTKAAATDTASSPVSDKPDDDAYWPEIASKDEIPGWLRDNDFLITGHPMPTYSYRKSFRLWRCLHMETMNIWTHLLGSAAFVATGFTLYGVARVANSKISLGDKFVFGIETTAAAVCFGLSATFHTLRSHSYHVHHFWGRMDIFSICVLALGGGVSASRYAWYCNQRVRNIYLGLSVGSTVAAAAALYDSGGGGNKMRTLRGGTFILLAVSALLPIYHRIGVVGWSEACIQFGAQWYLAEAATLLSGVTLFVTRLPERLRPGMFDVFGHSHQLHHICAVIGTAFHFAGLVAGYTYRQRFPQC